MSRGSPSAVCRAYPLCGLHGIRTHYSGGQPNADAKVPACRTWAENRGRSVGDGTGSCGSSAPSRNRLRRCDKRPGRSLSLVRYRGTELLRPHTVRPLRGARRLAGGHQLRRRGDCQAPAFIRARATSSSISCTICPCWSKRLSRRLWLSVSAGKLDVQVLRLTCSSPTEALERGVMSFERSSTCAGSRSGRHA